MGVCNPGKEKKYYLCSSEKIVGIEKKLLSNNNRYQHYSISIFFLL